MKMPKQRRKKDLIEEVLKNKVEELEYLEATNQALVNKERVSNDELVNAHQELISGLMENSTRSHISVKRMGGKIFMIVIGVMMISCMRGLLEMKILTPLVLLVIILGKMGI